MSVPESNYKRWLEKAENDLLNIENNLSTGRVPWDTICFHAQQAAEKVLKAYLVFHKRPLVRTHDLIELLAGCVEINSALTSLQNHCRMLSSYAVTSRYPHHLYEPTEEDGREMIPAARRLRGRILCQLAPQQT